MNSSTERNPRFSHEDFARLGVNHVAYVKAVEVDGRQAFAIHAADGTRIKLLADQDLALAAIRQNNLEPLSVH